MLSAIFFGAAIWAFNFCLFQISNILNNQIHYASYLDGLKNSLDRFAYFDALDAVTTGPWFEELIFRMLLMDALIKRRLHPLLAVLISALAFAFAHYPDWHNPAGFQWDVLASTQHFLAGLIYALIYLKTRRVVFPTMAHILYNVIVMIPKPWLYPDAAKSEATLPYIVVAMVLAIFFIKDIFSHVRNSMDNGSTVSHQNIL